VAAPTSTCRTLVTAYMRNNVILTYSLQSDLYVVWLNNYACYCVGTALCKLIQRVAVDWLDNLVSVLGGIVFTSSVIQKDYEASKELCLANSGVFSAA